MKWEGADNPRHAVESTKVKMTKTPIWLAALWSLGAATADAVDYGGDVQPLLQAKCYACHSGALNLGGVRLDKRDAAFGQGQSGKTVILPGESSESELIRRVSSGEAGYRMPPSGDPLSPEQVRLLAEWIDGGAQWGAEEVEHQAVGQKHWAFLPLVPVEPPDRGEPNPIDRFIGARLAEENIEPATLADPRTLIRRLSFDLAGLPPGPAEVTSFVEDASEVRYRELVDRLLDAPTFGERWARHWLDVARYADSEGYENDYDIEHLYRYRDWVIRALNDDLPFDDFVRLQLAGDEYGPNDPDSLAATGFLTAGPRVNPLATDTEENKQRYFSDELDDLVNTTGQAFLGLTLGCARCHDHKFDPVPTKDYYSLTAVFRNYERRDAPLSQPHYELERWVERRRAEMREWKMERIGVPEEDRVLLRVALNKNNSGQREAYGEWDEKLQFTEDEFLAWLGAERRSRMEQLQRAASNEAPGRGWVAFDRSSEPAPTYLLGRGDVRNKVEPVEFGFLTAFDHSAGPEEFRAEVRLDDFPSTFQRSALAEWLVDPEKGAGALTARVIVNRVWQHHFGRGLVGTPNDFGVMGERPSHPELLDWLAGRLIAGGWKLKPIHRLILASAAYRRSTAYDSESASVDPTNRLLWRREPRRLDAEALRDAILTVSGSLNEKMYGPGVRPPIPPAAASTRAKNKWPEDAVDGPETWRRSVYLFRKRAIRLPFLEVFDAPDESLSCGRRTPTTVPTQSLALLNDPFVRNQARLFADRVRSIADTPDEQIGAAFRIALARSPKLPEHEDGLALVRAGSDGLVDLCHTLFLLNEFAYVD